jgi:hypothetical protein
VAKDDLPLKPRTTLNNKCVRTPFEPPAARPLPEESTSVDLLNQTRHRRLLLGALLLNLLVVAPGALMMLTRQAASVQKRAAAQTKVSIPTAPAPDGFTTEQSSDE